MLELKARSGSGRILAWQAGRTIETPDLVVPETSLGVPEWARMVLTAQPGRHDAIEIVSGGTWFHPNAVSGGHGTGSAAAVADAPDGALTIPPTRPGPTGTPHVIPVGDELAVFHDAGGWATDPKRAVPAFIDAWAQAGGGRVFYAPALGTPADYALWTYLGVDLFDASPLLLAAVRGTALTPDGPLPHAEAQAVFGAAADDLVTFNLEQARQELANVRRAIRAGSLRALVERRAYASPDAVALLRRFDNEWRHLEARSPVNDTRPVPCMTQEALWTPEVERFRQRLREDYTPPASADILVLLPCSAKKPYRTSQTHRYFQRALDDSGMRHRVHEVMVTSPLGIVPRELEDTYPANLYDVPVTGHWNRDEEAIIRQQVAALLDKKEYAHVIGHVPTGTWTFLRDLFPENTLHTALGRPSSIEDCDRLKEALRAIRDGEREERAKTKSASGGAPSSTPGPSGMATSPAATQTATTEAAAASGKATSPAATPTATTEAAAASGKATSPGSTPSRTTAAASTIVGTTARKTAGSAGRGGEAALHMQEAGPGGDVEDPATGVAGGTRGSGNGEQPTDRAPSTDDADDGGENEVDPGAEDRETDRPTQAPSGSFRHARSRKLEDLRGLLSMQFGAEAADRLTSGASVRGKVPFVKLFDAEGRQLGQTTMDRGMLSLTLEGAAIVAAAQTKRVYQGDFQIRKTGSLFAAGVEGADADVRVGDDVVVMRGEEVTGCGVAQMTGAEMQDMQRGVAVTLRHVVKEVEVVQVG